METQADIAVTLVQPNVQWEDRDANLQHLSNLLSEVETTDLIVLPEMFPTGFSMRPEALAEGPNGSSTEWMRALAQTKKSTVVGSIITQQEGKYFNRLVWMCPDGSFEWYDKRHLFSFANEDDHYAPGSKRLVVDLNGWKICPLICYDLRFPVWSRNQALDGSDSDHVFDVLLFVANWPKARRRPWTTLLEARAHENQCYVIGVNRVGKDGNEIPHSGDSAIFSPKGELLSDVEPEVESVNSYTLSAEMLTNFRQKFAAWNDKDRFTIH